MKITWSCVFSNWLQISQLGISSNFIVSLSLIFIWNREKDNYESYSSFYNNLLLHHHQLLYKKELQLKWDRIQSYKSSHFEQVFLIFWFQQMIFITSSLVSARWSKSWTDLRGNCFKIKSSPFKRSDEIFRRLSTRRWTRKM